MNNMSKQSHTLKTTNIAPRPSKYLETWDNIHSHYLGTFIQSHPTKYQHPDRTWRIKTALSVQNSGRDLCGNVCSRCVQWAWLFSFFSARNG